MRTLFLLTVAGAVAAWAVGASAITQEEVDRTIADEIVLYEHWEPAAGALEVLIKKGASREMLAEAYRKVAMPLMNEPMGTVGATICADAIDGLGEFANDEQFTNIVVIALTSTSSLNVRYAMEKVHGRKHGSREFVDLADKVLARKLTNSGVLESVLWRCLKDDALADKSEHGEVRKRVLEFTRKHLSRNGNSAIHGDEIMLALDPAYKHSELRESIIRQVLESNDYERFNDTIVGKFREIKKKLDDEKDKEAKK